MMRHGAEEFDERFTAFVRSRGQHHIRMATLLTGDPAVAEDLVQASLLKLYRVWPRIDATSEPDAYLRRIIVNTRRSWWRARWRQETPVPETRHRGQRHQGRVPNQRIKSPQSFRFSYSYLV